MNFVGGPVAWLLVFLGVVSFVVFLERYVDLRRARIDYGDFLKGIINILDSGNDAEALSICDDTGVPVSSVVATAIRHRDAPARILREAVDAQGRAEIGRLDRRLAVLSIIGQIAPVLGLLGTVLGFVKALLVAHSGDVVARISLMESAMQALIATALGLMVAIPVAVMYGILRVRLDRLVSELEASASRILGYISTSKEIRK